MDSHWNLVPCDKENEHRETRVRNPRGMHSQIQGDPDNCDCLPIERDRAPSVAPKMGHLNGEGNRTKKAPTVHSPNFIQEPSTRTLTYTP